MSNTMKIQTSFRDVTGQVEQRFGKPNSLDNSTEEVEIVSSKNRGAGFTRLTIGSGGSPCWVSVDLEEITEVMRKGKVTTRRLVHCIALDKDSALQLAENIKTIAERLKPLKEVRPDLYD